jgi:glycosyltransferase involved in cell wall biosynthesis
VQSDREIDSCHIDLSEGLTTNDRALRRLICFQALGATRFSGTNIDLARWRHELHSGLLAARRIRACERRAGRFDILHFHTQATAYMSLGRMKRVPSIVSIDCTQRLASREAASRLERATYWPNIIHDRAVFRAAAAIIATSRWAAGDLAREHPDCARKLHVMPYPVSLESFEKRWVEERHARLEAGERPRVRVLFIGGDFNRKGGPELLAAWKAGDFAARAELKVVTDWPINESDLPGGASVVKQVAPFTDRWADLWQQADMFVMPTRGEAFGMVYQEAAAAGLPAIGTRINAVPEIIEDGVTGLLVEPGDERGLVRAIETLIASAHLRRSLGSAARERSETTFGPETYARKLTALIKQLAARNNY